MARQRSSTFEDIAVVVSRLPWWAGVGLAIVLYLWLHHVATQPLPAISADPKHMGDAVASQLWRTFALYLQYIPSRIRDSRSFASRVFWRIPNGSALMS